MARPGDPQLTGKALEVLSLMRNENKSLAAASREAGISPRAVRRRVGRAMTKRGLHWVANPWDRISRPVRLLADGGVFVVEVRDSRTASRVARYWNAVDRFLKTGDENVLREFKGRSFFSRGTQHQFLTDVASLQRLALVGEVQFEDLYARL